LRLSESSLSDRFQLLFCFGFDICVVDFGVISIAGFRVRSIDHTGFMFFEIMDRIIHYHTVIANSLYT